MSDTSVGSSCGRRRPAFWTGDVLGFSKDRGSFPIDGKGQGDEPILPFLNDPRTQALVAHVELRNLAEQPIAFQLKSGVPGDVKARPAPSGVIPAHGSRILALRWANPASLPTAPNRRAAHLVLSTRFVASLEDGEEEPGMAARVLANVAPLDAPTTTYFLPFLGDCSGGDATNRVRLFLSEPPLPTHPSAFLCGKVGFALVLLATLALAFLYFILAKADTCAPKH